MRARGTCAGFLISATLITSVWADPYDCFSLLSGSAEWAGPAAPAPSAPPEPVTPDTPAPAPSDPGERRIPKRREAPGRTDRDPETTVDPMDLLVSGAYDSVPLLNGFWSEIDPRIDDLLRESVQAELRSLRVNWHSVDEAIFREIGHHEAPYVDKFPDWVRALVARHFGDQTAQALELRFGGALPQVTDFDGAESSFAPPSENERPLFGPPSSVAGSADAVANVVTNATAKAPWYRRLHSRWRNWRTERKRREEPPSAPRIDGLSPWFRFVVVRREIYKLIAQAHGWRGMQLLMEEPIAEALKKIYPDTYRRIRQEQYRMLSIEIERIQRPEQSYVGKPFPAGREIISMVPEVRTDDYGQPVVSPRLGKAVAFGRVGFVVAHEAFKAAFQVATPLESAPRMYLSPTEREKLDDLTTTNVADLRQNVYGPHFERLYREGLAVFLKQQFSITMRFEDYLEVTNQVFSLLPAQHFRTVLRTLLLRNDPTDAVAIFKEFGIVE